MEINKKNDGESLVLEFSGRLDTTTAPDAETAAVAAVGETNGLIFDFAKLEYLSSAGLRVILAIHKKMTAKGGSFTVRNVNEIIMKVFKITGFSSIINIK